MRRQEGFYLAFLDVLACGLGAAVLILVLLKNQDGIEGRSVSATAVELASLEQEIKNLTLEVDRLKAEIAARSKAQSNDISYTEALISKLQGVKTQTQSKEEELARLKLTLNSVSKGLSKREADLKNAILESPQDQAQEFLIGLEVEGARIVILVDSSASMLAETLLEITLLKAKGSKDRQAAQKWVRTKEATQWLLANIPDNSEFRLFHFSDKVEEVTKGWSKANNSKVIAEAQSVINKIDPIGGTNIEQAMSSVLQINPSSVYLITDGLPTIGKRSQQLIPSGGCGGVTGRHRVSGECRSSLFTDVESLSRSFRGAISVVLLPLEGDPAAAPLYTRWALAHGGTLLSPAKDWP